MFRCAKFRIVVSVICLMVLMIPIQAQAFLDLSFDIFSFGPFSIGIGIPLKGLLPILGGGLLAGAANRQASKARFLEKNIRTRSGMERRSDIFFATRISDKKGLFLSRQGHLKIARHKCSE
ncbi:hypothetical protein QUF80_09115 [Desulfococcaceae bacterium HSG8]|nr:hypothetical protein [Desulfococcaceae bacterium HSG8]